MSVQSRHRLVPLFLLAAWAGSLVGCGGGGGGGGGGGSSSTGAGGTFSLDGVKFARSILDVSGNLADVVHPRTLYETDSITGVAVPGFPKVLEPGIQLHALVSVNLKQVQDTITPQIPLIPRNAALVLTFDRSVDVTSLALSNADPDNPNLLSAASPVQVLRQDGTRVPVRAWVQGKSIVLSAVTSDAVGWEASPLVFDSLGNAVEDPTGHLRVVTDAGTAVLRSTDGKLLSPRADLLGTLVHPMPFNPGNSMLDAIVLQTTAGLIRFNGFLPDLSAPRIIRAVTLEGTITAITTASVDGVVHVAIQDSSLSTAPNSSANGGQGEWALALLEITLGAGGVVRHVLAGNTTDIQGVPTFLLAEGTTLHPFVQPGNAFQITRSELFEPIPPPLPADPAELVRVTVDAVGHPRDPDDPQDTHNHDLRYFLRLFDEDGNERIDRWDPSTGKFLSVPPRTSVQVRFSEPMDVESFDPYETFYVTRFDISRTETAFNRQRVGIVQGLDLNRTIRFVPFLVDQVDPAASMFVGLGGTASSLKLVVRTLPDQASLVALNQSASPENLAQLLDLDETGVGGVADLGGRGLGLPPALLDQGDGVNFLLSADSPGRGPFPPAVDFQARFNTQPSSDPDFGAVVHRFLGQARSAVFSYPPSPAHDEVASGIEYYDYPPEDSDQDGVIDRRFIYGPELLYLGLNIPGRLTGAKADVIEHLMDDFNPPNPSPSAPTGQEDVLTKIGFGTRTPINSPFGVRFQHVYRAGDASPSFFDFQGIVLDLVGLAWSPLDNFVDPTQIDSFEILVGLGSSRQGLGPSTAQNNGIPAKGNSGLKDNFDCNLLEWFDNCCGNVLDASVTAFASGEPHQTSVVGRGTPYQLLPLNLFKPANAGSQFNLYLPYPAFNAGIDTTFGRSDVFSFPYDSRFPMIVEYRIEPNVVPPSTSNGYRFSPAVLSSALPRFRVWSQGQDPRAWCVPNDTLGSQNNQDYRGGEGGPLLRPGSPLAEPNGIPQWPYPGFPTQSKNTSPPFGNGMPQIGPYVTPGNPSGYQSPPVKDCTKPVGQQSHWRQAKPNLKTGNFPNGVPPTCNTLPEMNWYFANGMLAYPLPNMLNFPGPSGQPPTTWYGYGPPGTGNPPGAGNEPSYTRQTLGLYGDNSRYWMLWRYRKRISIIESPTIQVDAPSGSVRYYRPIITPPMSTVDPSESVLVEIKAGTLIDFSVPVLDSGFVASDDADLSELVTGTLLDRAFVKFRVSLGTAVGKTQPPSLDTIVIPYEKVQP